MTAAFDSALRVVAERFSVSVREIKSDRRTRAVLPARHVAAFLAHTVLGMSSREIGDRLGGRDYTNILMYCRSVARRAQEDEEFSQLLGALEAKVRVG
jgi:chromosomal replication initiator protein